MKQERSHYTEDLASKKRFALNPMESILLYLFGGRAMSGSHDANSIYCIVMELSIVIAAYFFVHLKSGAYTSTKAQLAVMITVYALHKALKRTLIPFP